MESGENDLHCLLSIEFVNLLEFAIFQQLREFSNYYGMFTTVQFIISITECNELGFLELGREEEESVRGSRMKQDGRRRKKKHSK